MNSLPSARENAAGADLRTQSRKTRRPSAAAPDGERAPIQRTAWSLALTVSALTCIGVWGFSVERDRRTVLAGAEAKLVATARLLEEHADRALEAGDRVVRAAALASARCG